MSLRNIPTWTSWCHH